MALRKLKFINKPLYYYRLHDKGISQDNNLQTALSYLALAKYKAYKRRLNTNIPNLTKEEIIRLLQNEVNNCIKRKDFKLARKTLLKVIRLNPFEFNNIKIYIKRIIFKNG